MDVGFEEFSMSAHLQYDGQAPVFSAERPNSEELLLEEDALARLSGFLVLKHARRVKVDSVMGRSHIYLTFEH